MRVFDDALTLANSAWHHFLDVALASARGFHANADAWSALFTLGLLIVAIVTARLGLRSLETANETLRLEARPYLVLTLAPTGPMPDHVIDNVLAPVLKGTLPFLRELDYGADEPRTKETGTSLSRHYCFRPQWPDVLVAVKNVGRSPAVGVKLEGRFSLIEDGGLDYDRISKDPDPGNESLGPWEAGRDYAIKARKPYQGFGWLWFPSIMAGETVYARIENRYAASAEISFINKARIVNSTEPAFVFVPDKSIRIPFYAPT